MSEPGASNEPTGTYRVVWIDEGTEFQGHGMPMSKEAAEFAATKGNKNFPGVKHEVVPVKPDGNQEKTP